MEPSDDPAMTHVKVETARLRAKGFTDAQIERILIEQEVAASQRQQGAAGAAGQGVMSGVLNNIGAVLAHARGVLPAVGKDIATLFGRAAATPRDRAKAAVFLALRAAVVVVFGYAVWQEWQIHIISAQQTAAGQAALAVLQADAAGHRTPMIGPTAKSYKDMGLAELKAWLTNCYTTDQLTTVTTDHNNEPFPDIVQYTILRKAAPACEQKLEARQNSTPW